jgi:hypothetical protein
MRLAGASRSSAATILRHDYATIHLDEAYLFKPWRNVHPDIYGGARNALMFGLMPQLYHFLTLLMADCDW